MNNIHWNKKFFLFLVLSFNQTFLNEEETPRDPSSEKVKKDNTDNEVTPSPSTTPVSETTITTEKKITLLKNLIDLFQVIIYNFQKNKIDPTVENKIIEIIQSPKFKIFQKILHTHDVNQKDNKKMQVEKDDLVAVFEFIVELMNIFEKEILGKNQITDLTEIKNSKNELS